MEITNLVLTLLVGAQVCSVMGDLSSEAAYTITYQMADEYLTSYGYYPPSDSSPAHEGNISPRTYSETERTEALTELQKFFNLTQTGQLDEETIQLMHRPRCGNADITYEEIETVEGEDAGKTKKGTKNQDSEHYRVNIERKRQGLDSSVKKRVKRYAFSAGGQEWRMDQMTWKITKWSTQRKVSKTTQRETLRKALDMWAEVVPIKFVEIPEHDQRSPDIEVWFARGRHARDPKSNDKPFSGKGGVLGHAWGPRRLGTDASGLPGDVHFDDDDDWSDNQELLGVALHELGHALGLGHSPQDSNAIMFPSFRDGATKIGVDDLRGIKELYGQKNGHLDEIICSTLLRDVDHIFRDPSSVANVYYVLSNLKLRIVSEEGVIEEILGANDTFPFIPWEITSAFSDTAHNSVYFIEAFSSGSVDIHQFMNLKKLEPIIQIYARRDENMIPEPPKYTVTVDNGKGGSDTFIFGERYWWKFDYDIELDFLPMAEHKPISDISTNFPRDIKYTVQWVDGIVYAIKEDGSYVTLDVSQMKMTPSSPIQGKPPWMKNVLCKEKPKPKRVCPPRQGAVSGNRPNKSISRSSLMLAIILSLDNFLAFRVHV